MLKASQYISTALDYFCNITFFVDFFQFTLYDAVVRSPASCDLNPAPEQSCALAYCTRQQMNTIDFNIFMFALVVE